MKKFLSLFVALTLSLVLVSCGPKVISDETNIPDALATDRQIDVVFWHAMGQANQQVIQDIIDDFNQIYPNINVTQFSQGDYVALRDKITQAIPAGTAPTIAQTYPDHVSVYLQGKFVRALDDYMKHPTWGYDQSPRDPSKTNDFEYEFNRTDDFVDTFFREGQVYDAKGTFYSLPFNKSTEVMLYNKTFFEEHNLQVPTTWEEVRTVANQIKAIDSDPTHRAFAYDSEANLFITMTKQWGGQYTNAAGEYLFNNQQSKDAVKYYVDMFNDGLAATPKFFNADFASDAFIQEKVYMTTGSSAGVSYNDPKGAFEVGIAPIPQKEGAAKNYVIQQGTNVTLFKQEDPQVELAGWLFLKFLTSPQETLRWATNTSYFPIRKSAYLSEEYQAHLFGPAVKKENGETLVVNGQIVRGTVLLDTLGNPTYDANGIPAYEPYEPSIQSYGTKVAYDQMDDFYTDPAFPGSSSARDQVELLVQAILYGGKTIDQAYAEALANLAE